MSEKTTQANFRFPRWMLDKMRENRAAGLGSARHQLQAAFTEVYMQDDQRAKTDSNRIDWLADPNNRIGQILLPTECVERNPGNLRDAIDEAMDIKQ